MRGARAVWAAEDARGAEEGQWPEWPGAEAWARGVEVVQGQASGVADGLRAGGGLRVALCQVESRVADFGGNVDACAAAVARAAACGAHVALLPELALSGYPPQDLLLRASFLASHATALAALSARVPPPLVTLLTGPAHGGGGGLLRNVVWALADGEVREVGQKALLPCYGPFCEPRHFAPRPMLTRPPPLLQVAGLALGLAVCEDLWAGPRYAGDAPLELLARAGADVLLVPMAAPWRPGQARARALLAAQAAATHAIPLLFVNALAVEDGLLFDGGSRLHLAGGATALALPQFRSAVAVYQLPPPRRLQRTPLAVSLPMPVAPPPPSAASRLLEALRTGLAASWAAVAPRAILVPLDGSLAAAMTLALATYALPNARVTAVAIPTAYGSGYRGGGVEDEDVIAQLANAAGATLLHLPPSAASPPPALSLPQEVECEEECGGEDGWRAVDAALGAAAGAGRLLLLCTAHKTQLAVGALPASGGLAAGLAPLADVRWARLPALAHALQALAPALLPEALLPSLLARHAAERLGRRGLCLLPARTPMARLDDAVRLLQEDAMPPQEAAALLQTLDGEEGSPLDAAACLAALDRAQGLQRRLPPLLHVSARAFPTHVLPLLYRPSPPPEAAQGIE